MRWAAPTVITVNAGAMLLAGCGGSADMQSSSGSTGGGPASASTTAGPRVADEAAKIIGSSPDVPVCNPGSLPNEDEETCAHFWNHLLAWQPLDAATQAASGPTMAGAGKGSMKYEGFQALEGASHWWGPNFCGGNPKSPTNCVANAAGLPFGQQTLVETYDDGSAVKSRVIWSLNPGDVSFGKEFFTAYNDGGMGGTQYAFCSTRGGTPSGQWVSCSPSSDDGATINCNQPADNNEDYCSFGWVVEDYPVLVGVSNALPDSRFRMSKPPSLQGVMLTAQGSSKGVVAGNASVASKPTGAAPALWFAGYRQRAGADDFGSITIQGTLESTTTKGGTTSTPVETGFEGATVTVSVRFIKGAKTEPTCKVSAGVAAGDQAKCDITEFSPGGVSTPGILTVVIQRGSGA